ncbi:MAG: glycerol kinase GlpK [Bdellovibrionales bacterium]|nr:glycerol kinase GlpK [Bdellovibrionales bacterium]
MSLILALDQGTTSSRALLFNEEGAVVGASQHEFAQHFPQPSMVEHNPDEIWSSQISAVSEVLSKHRINSRDIAAIGIANQRETTIVWDRRSGEPIYNAIVWQDRRTAGRCEELAASGVADLIRTKTGLLLDAYFSATKIEWILNHVRGSRKLAEAGHLCFGTVDSWLVWKLTDGAVHATDITNASRTMLFNIHSCDWDDELLRIFSVPRSMLPKVVSNSELIGTTAIDSLSTSIPIAGSAGDQQAALVGQMCFEQGMMKNTYGTGCFMVLNTGDKPVPSKHKLLTTIGWKIGEKLAYALEGSIFVAGAAVQWLRDGLEIIRCSEDSEELAVSVGDNGGVYLVPAFTGLGAPHWDPHARGLITGITRGTTQGHIVRATLEGIAYQVADVVEAMQNDAGIQIAELRVDGGATSNNFLMQFQSDILGIPLRRPASVETTARGAALLAGLAVGIWTSIEEVKSEIDGDTLFSPTMKAEHVAELKSGWNTALSRAMHWDNS